MGFKVEGHQHRLHELSSPPLAIISSLEMTCALNIEKDGFLLQIVGAAHSHNTSPNDIPP